MAIEQTDRRAEARRRNQAGGRINFAAMYATHDAFERDLRRLAAAVADGTEQAPGVRAGWAGFKHHLHVHHVSEDATLWPVLRRKATGPAAVEVLDAMEREHAQIDPLLERIDAAYAAADRGGLADAVADAAEALTGHLIHEELEALPLIEEHLTKKEWRAFPNHSRKMQTLSQGLEVLPWALSGASDETYQRAMALLPAPARLVYRRVLAPKYARKGVWSTAG